MTPLTDIRHVERSVREPALSVAEGKHLMEIRKEQAPSLQCKNSPSGDFLPKLFSLPSQSPKAIMFRRDRPPGRSGVIVCILGGFAIRTIALMEWYHNFYYRISSDRPEVGPYKFILLVIITPRRHSEHCRGWRPRHPNKNHHRWYIKFQRNISQIPKKFISCITK